ncbi:MAG: YceI family protein [Deltaproteobacteria bacterium]|nr:MAG: YceI family protein [Deltaproteobacteria bacterium]
MARKCEKDEKNRLHDGWFVVVSFLLLLFVARGGRAEEYLLERETPVRFSILSEGSRVAFHAKSTGHSFTGVTNRIRGEITFVPARIEETFKTEVHIDAASLDTDNKGRNKNMRKKYLETEKYPEISFVSDKFTVIEKGITQGIIRGKASGKLTIHGMSREIDLDVFGKIDGDTIQVRGETPLRITDFGIPLPKMLFIKVKDDIRVEFEVEGRRAEP